MNADSSLPMKTSEQLRADAVLIEEAWKKQRMLDIADEVEQLEAENERLGGALAALGGYIIPPQLIEEFLDLVGEVALLKGESE